eukprot:Hpha_TRINITY_DN1730_c0_g1::TRINITY_DN1730_c0_g1_i1::g.158608::m.158608
MPRYAGSHRGAPRVEPRTPPEMRALHPQLSIIETLERRRAALRREEQVKSDLEFKNNEMDSVLRQLRDSKQRVIEQDIAGAVQTARQEIKTATAHEQLMTNFELLSAELKQVQDAQNEMATVEDSAEVFFCNADAEVAQQEPEMLQCPMQELRNALREKEVEYATSQKASQRCAQLREQLTSLRAALALARARSEGVATAVTEVRAPGEALARTLRSELEAFIRQASEEQLRLEEEVRQIQCTIQQRERARESPNNNSNMHNTVNMGQISPFKKSWG